MYHGWIWSALLNYVGELYIEWDVYNKVYQRQVFDDQRTPQPRINKFAPAIDAIASNFQQVPEVEAVPTPMDSIERTGIADVCNLLATHFLKDSGLRNDYKAQDDKVGLAGQLFVLTGGLLTCVTVEDKEIGRSPVMEDRPGFGVQCLKCDQYSQSEEEPQACPNCGNPDINVQPVQMQAQVQDEEGIPQTNPITEKHVRCDIENMLFFYPRSGALNMRDKGWMMIAQRLGLDEIYSRFGIEAVADNEYPDGWNTTNENALNFFYMGYSNTNLNGKDAAMVIRVYCEPGKVKDFPDGFYGIYVNGECKKAVPWNFKEDPFSKADYKTIPTLIMPRSVAFDLVPIQSEKTRLWRIFTLHGTTTAVDPWVVDSDTECSEITGRGDMVITYRKITPESQPPHHAGAGHLDPDLYRLDDKLDKEFDNIGQTVAVYRGEQPGSITAAAALQSLKSQAEFMFSGSTAAWNNCWKETVRKSVKYYQKFPIAQLTEIVGDDKQTELQAFLTSDLDECVEWIASKSGLPRTRDDRRQEMMTLFDKGALDIQDPNVKQKLFELFGDTGMMSTFNKDATRARMENATIQQGGQPMFMPEIEDLATHYGIHVDKIKSPDFLKWSPEAQQELIKHAMFTKQAMQGQVQPSEKVQVQQMKSQTDMTTSRLDRDAGIVKANIASNAKLTSDVISALMASVDAENQALEQGNNSQPAAQPPNGGSQ